MILQRVATRLPFQLARLHVAAFKKPSTPNIASKITSLSVRNSGGSKGYRCLPPEDPLMNFLSDSLMTIVWAYMFWNLYHHGGTALNFGVHVPNYELATDAQLGIEEE